MVETEEIIHTIATKRRIVGLFQRILKVLKQVSMINLQWRFRINQLGIELHVIIKTSRTL